MSYVRTSGLGDLPSSCNTAGGYAVRQPSCWMTAPCMTVDQFNAAEAACKNPAPAQVVSTDPATGIMTIVPPPAPPVSNPPMQGGPVYSPLPFSPALNSGSGVASGSIVDSAVAWVKANPLLAAGIAVGAVLLVGRL